MSEDVTAKLEELKDEVTYLKGLFARRLDQNKAINESIQSTKELAQTVQERVLNRDKETMFDRLLTAVERLSTAQPSAELNTSVREEFLQVLGDYGIHKVDTSGKGDPEVHDYVDSRPVQDSEEAGQIVEVIRDGYTLDGRAFRPARVVIAQEGAPSAV